MDYFFAQVEELDRPDLKHKPFAIGGLSETGRGVLSTSNYIARKFGVKSAMPTALALKKCPELILVRSHFDKYRKVSAKIFEIFARYTTQIERLSLDEAYLDVTDCTLHNNDAIKIAKNIKEDIFRETKLTASAGVSFNKLLAKIGSDLNKPNGLSVLRPEGIAEKIAHFEVGKINGVGKVTQEKMHKLGLRTFGDLQKLTLKELVDAFGDSGVSYYHYCRGIDKREVKPHRERKSLSVERTFHSDLKDHEELLLKLEHCFEEMLDRLKKHQDKKIKTLFVKIKYSDFQQTTIEAASMGKLKFNHFEKLFSERVQENDKVKTKGVRLIGTGVKFLRAKNLKNQLTFWHET
ncbi:MAG: DNA polymerase IV [Halobacteriovoraceae bacterium]|nr:DNA polymerase IV [Halobacteriovoraceae bacterium]|tara:strand:+ start:5561 stop:6610 length:1050 start_codon:yes stop_codon:yes gene_type:complete